ncbi:MAG TPA: DUF4384 domain-containing protein [Blastocatellia bacterium]|nr:DUF4384 domain-containing protein [Blastocatellia bacterium]
MKIRSLRLLAFLFCVVVYCGLSVPAQESGTRQIYPEEFVKARPAKTAGTARKSAYRKAGAKPTAGAQAADANYQQLGLTIWRLRPANAADTGARIIVQEGENAAEWTPERVAADTPLRMGERVRFSFESPQSGYLYVIDRERYADGSMGEPYLIFPTSRTRNGDNQVAAGRIIEIPAQDDRPNFFTLRQSRGDQTGEVLTVLVTPQPLEGIAIGPKALALAPEQVAQWEKQWGAQSERFELSDGAGKAWTRAEQQAGADATRQLTQDDPGPQTIYRVASKFGAPILVKVGLRYSQPKVRSSKQR